MKTRPVPGDAATIAYHAELYRIATNASGIKPADHTAEPLPDGYAEWLSDADARTITPLTHTTRKIKP